MHPKCKRQTPNMPSIWLCQRGPRYNFQSGSSPPSVEHILLYQRRGGATPQPLPRRGLTGGVLGGEGVRWFSPVLVTITVVKKLSSHPLDRFGLQTQIPVQSRPKPVQSQPKPVQNHPNSVQTGPDARKLTPNPSKDVRTQLKTQHTPSNSVMTRRNPPKPVKTCSAGFEVTLDSLWTGLEPVWAGSSCPPCTFDRSDWCNLHFAAHFAA